MNPLHPMNAMASGLAGGQPNPLVNPFDLAASTGGSLGAMPNPVRAGAYPTSVGYNPNTRLLFHYRRFSLPADGAAYEELATQIANDPSSVVNYTERHQPEPSGGVLFVHVFWYTKERTRA